MWFGEDRRMHIIKTHVSKRLDYVFKHNYYFILKYEHNSEDQCIHLEKVDKHAIMINRN